MGSAMGSSYFGTLSGVVAKGVVSANEMWEFVSPPNAAKTELPMSDSKSVERAPSENSSRKVWPVYDEAKMVKMDEIRQTQITFGRSPTTRSANSDSTKSVYSQPAMSTSVAKEQDFTNISITFEKVTFSYPLRPTVLALNDVSLTIPPKTSLSIVGSSGGGKSTLLALLERYYEISSGRIFLNGVELSSMRVQQSRSFMALVSQDVALLEGTMKSNIAYGTRMYPRTLQVSLPGYFDGN